MVLRRLRPGRKTDSAREGAPVSGEDIAELLESLATASTSATWKCRHGAGSVLVEGTVDFASRESRATVIRGKATYEYIRRGSTAFRAPVVEDAPEDAGTTYEFASETDACGIHAYAIPGVLAAAVRAAGNLNVGKAEEVGERKLTPVTVTLKPKTTDSDGKVARLARQLRDHGAMVLTVSALVEPSGWDEETDEPTGPRIERLRLELPHWTPADNPMDDHAVTVELFDLNEPVEIHVPEESDSERRRTNRTCADLALF
ncbi:MAG TPA: hypothetical protein VFN97_10020 [Actinospica sp.]|nr:hypothetical protein [Actinospica sp.]